MFSNPGLQDSTICRAIFSIYHTHDPTWPQSHYSEIACQGNSNPEDKTLDNGGRATQRGHIRPPSTRHNWVNSSWRRPVVAKLPTPTTSSHDLVGDQVENLCNLSVFVTIWLPLTCRCVLKYLCMPDPDPRSSLRMRTNVDDVWTSGPCRTLLLILCSAKIALVQANGGAILPSLNKVNILRNC